MVVLHGKRNDRFPWDTIVRLKWDKFHTFTAVITTNQNLAHLNVGTKAFQFLFLMFSKGDM